MSRSCDWGHCEKEGKYLVDCTCGPLGDYRYYCKQHEIEQRKRMSKIFIENRKKYENRVQLPDQEEIKAIIFNELAIDFPAKLINKISGLVYDRIRRSSHE